MGSSGYSKGRISHDNYEEFHVAMRLFRHYRKRYLIFFFIYSPHPDFGPRHVRNPISVNHALERKYTYLVRRTRNSLA